MTKVRGTSLDNCLYQGRRYYQYCCQARIGSSAVVVVECDSFLDWLQVRKTKVETWTVHVPQAQSHVASVDDALVHVATAQRSRNIASWWSRRDCGAVYLVAAADIVGSVAEQLVHRSYWRSRCSVVHVRNMMCQWFERPPVVLAAE